ncbi:hypothetical protein AGMMS50276_11950 [Synergistales bacterium]|nr:hypothetical protein AGMMS50276_11950 [Synergistales bacterium]
MIMDVTSMLSGGYLQPARNTLRSLGAQKEASEQSSSSASNALSIGEQQVLSQERALKAASPGAEVTTVYHYAVGADGRRYISGAEVMIQGDEKAVNRIGGGVKRQTLTPAQPKAGVQPTEKPSPDTPKTQSNAKAEPSSSKPEQPDPNSAAVQELKQIEREVVAHEAAHQAAAGSLAGGVSYTYTTGPDGRSYITGGEVPIHVASSSNPEETLRNMERAQRAALAPGEPSGQDRAVAASAAAAAAQARQQIAARASNTAEGASKLGVSSVKADMRSERIRGGETEEAFESSKKTETPKSEEVEETYSRNASPNGLWALGRGFENMNKNEENEENRETEDMARYMREWESEFVIAA